MSESALKATTWVVAFLPVALFTAIVFDRVSDMLPIGSATRWFFIGGLLAMTALAAATIRRALQGSLDRRHRPRGTGA